MNRDKHPLCILLFSGKRKSGKDYVTNKLLELSDKDKYVMVKISAPIKAHFSETYDLNLNDLMSSGEYKENFRTEMIKWSEEIRKKDPGTFCKAAVEMYNAASKPVWIVSDVRRKTDIFWFKENYGDVVKTIRVHANQETRTKRGWVFTTGVDDVASECDLDDYTDWDWQIDNNGDEDSLNNLVLSISQYLNQII